MVGPIMGSFVSKGTSVTLNPDIRYKLNPDSIATNLFRLTPTPLSDKGLIGIEKYPFFGKKKENDTPIPWALAVCIVHENNAEVIKTIPNVFLIDLCIELSF